MNNNKGNGPPLQRHRRRGSDHVSPISPSLSRRFVDRPNRYSDALSPAEPTSSNDDLDSPSLNLTLSSPAYEHLRALPSAPPTLKSFSFEPRHHQRLSEDNGRPRYRTSDENARPATSDAVGAHATPPHPTLRTAGQYTELPSRPALLPYNTSPNDLRDRTSVERQAGRPGDGGSSPSFRNYSFSSPVSDRPASDDSPHGKLHAGKKSRLNLLNPMSLLARRRSSQNQKLEDVNLSIKTFSVPALPDDFDPSIRGKVVHDFSAPRTRRMYSQNDISSADSPALRSADPNCIYESPGERLSTNGTPNLNHSPMFKEHFQDDRPSLRPDRTGYLHNFNASHMAHAPKDPDSVPEFAKRLPAVIPQPDLDFNPLTPDKENIPMPPRPVEPSPPPPTPPPKSTPSPRFDPPPAAALPKHMTSTSSRFSFQMGDLESSAQERLLEEKHKQHEATKKTTAPGAEEDDDYADYDFDADDGFEEPIPGINANYEEDDGFGDDIPEANALVARYGPTQPETRPTELQRQSLQGFRFTPQSLTFSPTSTNNASQPTPRDQEGFPIGIAETRESSQRGHLKTDGKTSIDTGPISLLGGLGISAAEVHGRRTQHTSRPQGQIFDDDDLYFDDGEFGDLDVDIPSSEFDERIFDDETSTIRDIPAENARKLDAARHLAGADGEVERINPWDDVVDAEAFGGSGTRTNAPPASFEPSQAETTPPTKRNPVAGLTETNLAAYHDALALAANRAASEGKFDRKVSFSQSSDDTSPSPSQRGVISDDSRFSYNISSAIAEDDGFPFDDDLDDDPMIAEANAEALENDDEGFYGREFGFYARSNAKGNSELVIGGYFAERGSNGIKRSHSGKANFQEPSLTPITERSEWSTRNSVASLQLPGGMPASAQSLPSPGIAQLLELDSPGFDEDMSFSALLKLRGRTFGGSTSSISSSAAGNPVSSPLAHFSNHIFPPGDLNAARMSSSLHGRSSPTGIPESEEEEDEADRPTLTRNTPRKISVEPMFVTSQEDMPSSPGPMGGERRKGRHSRTSSGAESVTYSRDRDGRWVLERRRTDEESGAEVVDREILAGARI
ncbi:hypothetical protein LTR99_003824 [Exophiala xenobiotica]|nr:hypothetical protein H2202_007552 [Exophiala xenobiotica]KAK5544696.1 hypothetical protein LTR23_004136 [Chaetothyriales sp. CCFEE 6169]KAK5191350.1 hypothetical protein LTR92_008521 [Exophiala xenobiotica]KAK5207033.1 hypothetical protein LTR41_007100 [Exophiala xenobiotica]KAK5218172.1 hypothetical protein LTR72_008773 [Exophiala xenobiotica]